MQLEGVPGLSHAPAHLTSTYSAVEIDLLGKFKVGSLLLITIFTITNGKHEEVSVVLGHILQEN